MPATKIQLKGLGSLGANNLSHKFCKEDRVLFTIECSPLYSLYMAKQEGKRSGELYTGIPCKPMENLDTVAPSF